MDYKEKIKPIELYLKKFGFSTQQEPVHALENGMMYSTVFSRKRSGFFAKDRSIRLQCARLHEGWKLSCVILWPMTFTIGDEHFPEGYYIAGMGGSNPPRVDINLAIEQQVRDIIVKMESYATPFLQADTVKKQKEILGWVAYWKSRGEW